MKLPEDLLDQISHQATTLLGQGRQAREDLHANLRSLVQAQLAKLDVVSREEFDAQQAVLERTRAQLAELEEQLKTMEQRLENDQS